MPEKRLLYVANLSGGKAHTLQACEFDPGTGKLGSIWTGQEGAANSLYVRVDATGRYLFVADLVNECDGKPGGAVLSYRIDRDTGALTLVSRQHCGGKVPCYISATRNGKFILVANYGDGTVAVLPVNDGKLAPVTHLVQHRGADPEKTTNVHSIVLDASERFALAADLGADRIFIYRFDADTGKLTPNDPPHVQTAAKAGPRHLAFHPNGDFLYCQTEYDNTVIAMSYCPQTGEAAIIDVQSSLPAGYDSKTFGADIAVHPSGQWLYSTNRGHESVAMFAIDPGTGKLTLLGHEPTQGRFPRSFVIDPTGAFLLVGNEKSDLIVALRIRAQTGRLEPSGQTFATPQPAGLCFA